MAGVEALGDNGLIVQWASRVIAYSSQYNNSGWSANQILGQPKVYPRYGDHTGAWAQGICSEREYIELEYPKKVFVSGLDIYETLNGGAVTRIQFKHPASGQWYTVYESGATKIEQSRVFKPSLEITDFETNQIRIEQNCQVSGTWCEIDAVNMKGHEYKLAPPPTLEKLADDFGELVDNEEYSDVKLRVEKRIFHAYKGILVMRSEYFRAMFGPNGMRETRQQVIDIPEVGEESFRAVLQYIYTNNIDHDQTDSNLVEIIRVADRFSLDGLQKLCIILLHKRLDTDNVVSIYLAATKTLPIIEEIKNECIRYITLHMSTVTRTPMFSELPQDVMLEIIQASTAKLNLS